MRNELTITSLNEYYDQLLKESLLEEQVSQKQLDLIDQTLEQINDFLDSNGINFKSINNPIEQAQNELASIISGDEKKGFLGSNIKKKLNDVSGLALQVSTLLSNIPKIKNLIPRNLQKELEQTGTNSTDTIKFTLAKAGPAGQQAFRNIIKFITGSLQPSWLSKILDSSKIKLDPSEVANDLSELPWEKFTIMMKAGAKFRPQQLAQNIKSTNNFEEPDGSQLLPDDDKSTKGNETAAVQKIARNTDASQWFVRIMDMLKKDLGDKFSPDTLEQLYSFIKRGSSINPPPPPKGKLTANTNSVAA